MKNRVRFLSCLFFLVTLALVACREEHNRGFTPTQSGAPLPVYASAGVLADAGVTGLSLGSQAWVTNSGTWVFQPVCPALCDGTTTCVTAGGQDGGVGCWTTPSLASSIFQMTCKLTGGATTTCASGKTLTNAKILGVFLTTQNDAGIAAQVGAAISANNIVLTPFIGLYNDGGPSVIGFPDGNTYTVVLAGAQ